MSSCFEASQELDARLVFNELHSSDGEEHTANTYSGTDHVLDDAWRHQLRSPSRSGRRR